MNRHVLVTCFVEKTGFEPRTLGTKAERYDHCATRSRAQPPITALFSPSCRSGPSPPFALPRHLVDFEGDGEDRDHYDARHNEREVVLHRRQVPCLVLARFMAALVLNNGV